MLVTLYAVATWSEADFSPGASANYMPVVCYGLGLGCNRSSLQLVVGFRRYPEVCKHFHSFSQFFWPMTYINTRPCEREYTAHVCPSSAATGPMTHLQQRGAFEGFATIFTLVGFLTRVGSVVATLGWLLWPWNCTPTAQIHTVVKTKKLRNNILCVTNAGLWSWRCQHEIIT